MNEQLPPVRKRHGVGRRLGISILLGIGLVAALFFLLMTVTTDTIHATVDHNGRLHIQSFTTDPFSLHIQRQNTGLLLRSGTNIAFNGKASRSVLVPAATSVQLQLGADAQTLTFRPDSTTDVTVHNETAVLTLNATSDLHLTSAQLNRPLAVHGRHVTVEGTIATGQDLAMRSDTLTMAPGSRLTATQGDILLAATQHMQLQESDLYAAGDIRLSAGDTLTIRDSAARPFVASAGERLVIQGDALIDISALTHRDSVLASGSNMVLRSAAPVRGDALYLSGGQVQIAQLNGRAGDLLSPYDPIVLANGDVTLGSYTGASLHIVAGGSVLLNSAVITGTDTTANTINAANTTPFNGSDTIADLAAVTLSNGTAVSIDGSARALLDVRAGVDWSTFAGGAPGNQTLPPGAVTPTFAPASGAAITVTGGITVTQPEGVVLLTNQYRPNAALSGGISTGDVNVSTTAVSQNGGDIVIDARSDVATGRLDAFAEVAGTAVTAGNGGNVTVLAPAGAITTGGDVNAYTRTPANSSGAVGNGGDILLAADSGIDVNGGSGNVNASAFANSDGDAGDGGAITLTTTGGDVTARTLNSASLTFTDTVPASNGGDILITTGNGRVTIAGDGFFNGVSAYTQSPGPGGSGGTVAITATQGIAIGQAVRAYANGLNANGGNVRLHTGGGNLTVGDVIAFAADSGDVGSGGSVALEALNGSVTSGDIQTFADSLFINNDAQDGGSIVVRALNGDAQTGALESFTEARGLEGDTGNAGAITVTAGGSLTTTGSVQAYALAAQNNNNSGTAGSGGSVTLQATDAISIAGEVNAYSEADGPNGTAANGGDIAITANNRMIRVLGDVNAYANAPGFPSGDAGSGGSIALMAGTGIDVADGQLNAFANSQGGTVGSGGSVTAVTGSGDILLESANASARNPFAGSSLGTGNGGDMTLSTGAGRVIVNPGNGVFVHNALNTQSAGPAVTGNGGDITITATQGIELSGHVWANVSGDDGNGGSIMMTTDDGDIVVEDVWSLAIDNDGTPGSGGNVLLQAVNGAVETADVLAYSLALLIHNDSQDGGDITIAALNGDASTGQIATYTEARGLLGDTGTGGSINVITGGTFTTTGAVQTYAWAAANNLNSGVAGDAGNVTLQATGAISIAGSIDTFSAAPGDNGTAASAGNATVTAGGEIAFTYVDARARSATGTVGSGGTVIINSGQSVRGIGTPFNSAETIAAAGLANSSAITITHGGAGVTPFTVGDVATNGTVGALSTGDALITPTASFLYSHFEAPNIWILSQTHPLTLTKTAVPDVDVPFQGEITYTVVLSNPATTAAAAVSLSDPLPAEVDFNRWVQQPVGADVTADVLTWSGDVPANDAITFTFVVDHVGDSGDVFTNTAVFEHPSTLGSGSAAATVSIEAAANLAITKTVDTPTAVPGDTIRYTLAFANVGPGDARGVVITDVVPAALTNLSVSSSGAAITPVGGNPFAWTVADLAAGEGGVITITADLSTPLARDLTITNTAVITGTTAEADDGDNADGVTVTVRNAAPQAVDDTATTDEDTPVNIAVLANDDDANGDGLTLVAVGAPGSGSSALNGATVDYAPDPNFNGTDTFTYTVGDGLLTATALVTVTVTPQNDAPVALDNAYSTAEDTPLSVIAAAGVLSNDTDVDGDGLSAVLVDDVTDGTLSLAADGGLIYTPTLNFVGPVTFTYQATDTVALSNVATVTITVGQANDAPIAVADVATTAEDTTVTVDVLRNDSDPENDTLAVVGAGSGANGTTAVVANQVSYTPNLNFNGTDVFTYTVSDGQLSATTAVTVTVTPVNDPPQFTSTPATVAQTDALYSYTVTAADVDGSDTLTIQALVLPPWLSLVDLGGGTAVLSGTTTAADAGDHTVTLQVSDGDLTATQTFTITVSAEREPHFLFLPFISKQTAPPAPSTDLVVTDLTVSGSEVTVVIQNQGAGPTPNDFWVDVYVNPTEPPSLNKTWQLIAEAGVAWGVTDPIPAGGTLTLIIGDAYYVAAQSDFSGLTAGDVVWAQVDVVNLATTYGNVPETDETNNVYGPITYTGGGTAVGP